MKTRREVLQGIIVSIGGASMLTACGGVANVLPTARNASAGEFYSRQEMRLVSRFSDLLIPRTDTPGALDVNVPGYLDVLMNEWASSDTKQDHHEMLARLDQDLTSRAGEDFTSASNDNAEQALLELDAAAFLGAEGYGPYRSFKGLVTQAYFATEEGALEEQGWVATPGRWDPCADR